MELAVHMGGRARSNEAPAAMAAQMRAFLAGYDNGAALLHALYDPILDEPVPARLRALLKR